MKDCPWCHTDPNEITALKQRVAELEREGDSTVQAMGDVIRSFHVDGTKPPPSLTARALDAIKRHDNEVVRQSVRECVYALQADIATLTKELAAARKVCEAATRWWDTATVAHDAGVEYRVKGDAESRLRAVAADAAHADTIVGLGEAIEAYRATNEPRDDE